MEKILLLTLTVTTFWILETSAFFFQLNPTETTERIPTDPPEISSLFANKPIHIHHHYKWKYVTPAPTLPPTTTTPSVPTWSWIPKPSWSVKPVFEQPQEDIVPHTKWQQPYKYWRWTSTTTETPELINWPETSEPSQWQTPEATKWQPPITTWHPYGTMNRQKWTVKRNLDSQSSASTKSLKTATATTTTTTSESPDEVEIHWPSTETVPVGSKILYKYRYNVHSPGTSDIKMHQEQSDGSAITGHYSFVEPNGKTRVVYYTARKDGFNAHVKHYNLPLNNHNVMDFKNNVNKSMARAKLGLND